jgi:hypothetical protein
MSKRKSTVQTLEPQQIVCGLDGCRATFSNEKALFRHQKMTVMHGAPKKFKCTVDGCNAAYVTNDDLTYHMNTHNNCADAFACLPCGKTFQQKRLLAVHIAKVHGIRSRNFPCTEPDCDSSFYSTNLLQKHIDCVHRKLRPFPCLMCDWSFQSECHLKRHAVIHCEEKFECRVDTDCEYKFNCESSRDAHERLHTGEKPYVCDTIGCTGRFRTSQQLRMHKIDHGSRPFPCDQCDWACKTLYHLTEHRRTHTGERPFACDVIGCKEKFTHSAGLLQHVVRHHNGGHRVMCNFDGCGRIFATAYECRMHEIRIHEAEDGLERLKLAELRIEKILTENVISFDREQKIEFSCVDENNHHFARLDFVIPTKDAVIILEIDESQHKGNEISCEVARMARVQAAISLGGFTELREIPPILWIRYNPNTCRLDGIKRSSKVVNSSGLTDREVTLLNVIANPNLGDRSAGILYMYYDSKTQTNADGSTTIIPLVVDSPDYVAFMREMVLPAIA